MVACAGATGSSSISTTAEGATTTTPSATTTTSAPTTTTTSPTTTTTSPTSTTTAAPQYHATISDVDAAQLAHSYTPDCPVTPEELVMVTLDHWGFDGESHRGQIVVARSQGDKVAEIFRRLFEIGYPIESVIPIG